MSNENRKTLAIERATLARQEIKMILKSHGVTLESGGHYIAIRSLYRTEEKLVRRLDIPFKIIGE